MLHFIVPSVPAGHVEASGGVHFTEHTGCGIWSNELVHTPLSHSVDPVSTTVVHVAPNERGATPGASIDGGGAPPEHATASRSIDPNASFTIPAWSHGPRGRSND